METREILNKSIKDHQKALDEATAELKKLEATYSIGDRFKHEYSGEKYMIVITYKGVGMTSLRYGTLCGGFCEVSDTHKITPDELVRFAGNVKVLYWDSRKGCKV